MSSEALMKSGLLFVGIALLANLGCNSPSEVAAPPSAAPAEQAPVAANEVATAPAPEPLQAAHKEAKQSYSVCMDYCVMVMDQAGQVTDECPTTCREDPDTYTKADLHSDDQNNGLIAFPHCLAGCLGTPADTSKNKACQQSCCVESCALRQEYSGSGMASKCPAMCREFLERTASN